MIEVLKLDSFVAWIKLVRSMASNLANEGEGSSRFKRNLDGWKFPKIPIDQVYKKRMFRIFPSYAVTDYEKIITLKHKFLHLGLVQIAIKPLLRDGIGAPVVVCLRDARHLN
uniref:Uncharacterized protein n=1 Tax=Chenopodium quinoa TaxID=63459 RepID=A0A803LTT9_CHEQI